MYEELQLKTMPKPPKPIKSILADGFVNKLFGIVSPSKLFMIHSKTNLSLEERLYLESEAKYFEDILKHKVYTRQASREDWNKLYRRYRIKNNSKRQSINGKEFDTYKVGTVANSCSTMHKIHEKEFTLEDFSHEHLIYDLIGDNNEAIWYKDPPENGPIKCQMMFTPLDALRITIGVLNTNREAYLKTKNKKYWWQMIQLLPSSYNQKRTVMMNYEVLANIYKSRKNHKLDEWHTFCDWVESLPYSELIIGEKK